MAIFIDEKTRYVHGRVDTEMRPNGQTCIQWVNRLKQQLNGNGHELTTLRYDGDLHILNKTL